MLASGPTHANTPVIPTSLSVIPAKVGSHYVLAAQSKWDSRLRGNDRGTRERQGRFKCEAARHDPDWVPGTYPQLCVPAATAFSVGWSSSSSSRLATRIQPCFLNFDSSRLMLSIVSPR
jgi:hypothetical protein